MKLAAMAESQLQAASRDGTLMHLAVMDES